MSISEQSLYNTLGVPETESEKAFDTYRFYLKCFRNDLKEEYSNFDNLAKRVWAKYQLLPTSTGKTIDGKVPRRFLFIAWNTEYLAKTNIPSDIEVLKISNQWRPIQAYYSIYSAGEAASYVLNGELAESHATCIRNLNCFFVERVRIRPWHFAYTGNNRNGFTSYNFPTDTKPISNLSRRNPKDIDIIATCLQAEHRNRIDDFEPRKLSPNQKKRGEKKSLKVDFDPKYTTLLNFLYRLRIKSNYKDAEIFMSNSPDSYVNEFVENLSVLVDATLMVLEMLIIKQWGFDNFKKLFDDYFKSTRLPSTNGDLPIKKRIDIYSKILSIK